MALAVPSASLRKANQERHKPVGGESGRSVAGLERRCSLACGADILDMATERVCAVESKGRLWNRVGHVRILLSLGTEDVLILI